MNLVKYEKLIVAFLLSIMFILAVSSMLQKSVTSDEVTHLPAGYSYIKTNDFRMNPEHPPLVKELSGLFLLLINPNIDVGSESWENTWQWVFGKDLLYNLNDNTDEILFFGRLPIVLLSLLLGFFVYLFAKKLYGVKAGLFALLLYVFSPNILAHSRFVTTDLGGILFLFLTMFYLYNFLKDYSLKNFLLFSLFFGLAQVAKFSNIFLVVLVVVVLLVKFNKKIIHAQPFSVIRFFLIFLVLNIFIVNLFYGFNDLYNNKSKSDFVKDLMPGKIEFIEDTVYNVLRPVPIAGKYIEGLSDVLQKSKSGHMAYLMGEYNRTGWRHYFIVAFLVKTPISTLILIVLSLVLFRRIKHHGFSELFLILPILLYFIVLSLGYINIGLRHILVIYPFIFVFVSKVVNYKKIKIMIIILSLWYVISSLLIYPHYLAYFNEAIGPDNGHKYLIDSNLDWGQDLKGLDKWLENNEITEKIKLNYDNKLEANYRGINYERYNFCEKPTTGLFAIRINNLVGSAPTLKDCFRWLDEHEPIAKIGYTIWVYDLK